MELIGYLATILVGVTLGLIGGGGSIFTIPVLVYLFQIPAVDATSYSHFIVGITAIFASINNFKSNKINNTSILAFGLPSVLSVYFSRTWLLPLIPNEINIGSVHFGKNLAILLLFSIMMITASYSMIKRCETCAKDEDDTQIKFNFPLLIISGFAIGILTGIVGAGGGFLIIPALVYFAKLPMKKAIATSLVIISIKSLIGFSSEVLEITINWHLLITTSILSILGMFIGTKINHRFKGEQLKPTFGWLILFMGIILLGIQITNLRLH